MDIQALSPEIIQDISDDSIAADLITSTFSSTSIGKFPPPDLLFLHPTLNPRPKSFSLPHFS